MANLEAYLGSRSQNSFFAVWLRPDAGVVGFAAAFSAVCFSTSNVVAFKPNRLKRNMLEPEKKKAEQA